MIYNTFKRKILKPLIADTAGTLFRIFKAHVIEKGLTVFVYHDISDNPSEFSRKYDLNVCPEIFDYQINFIKNNFNVINPDELLSGRIPSKAALVTFDDGFRSYFKNAVPILEKYSVPSLIFLNMEPVKGSIFWSGLITYLCEKNESFRTYLASSLNKETKDMPLFLSCSRNIVNSYVKDTGESFKEKVSAFVGEFAGEKDLAEASVKPLVFYGSHLFNHDVPILMSDEELLGSYSQNSDCLIRYSNYRDIFSFPFGQPGTCFSNRQVDLIIKNGAKRVFSSTGNINWNVSSLCLDRIPLTAFNDSDSKIWFQIFQMSFRRRLNA